MIKILLFLLSPSTLLAGSFPGAAGSETSDAIAMDSPLFTAWASGHWEPGYGTDVDTTWKTPEKALGQATGNVYNIVSLGNGGSIVLHFPKPITDGPGPDFAVFENSFSPTFLELAFVEVSSDGIHFFRFDNRSEGTALVGPYSTSMDPTTLSGLAGKYLKGFGTPFDLATLAEAPFLNRKEIRFVRILDIIGDGSVKDSTGASIYDPTPSIGSGGFDLEAIGVIHQNDDPVQVLPAQLTADQYRLRWQSNPGTSYRIFTSTDLVTWTLDSEVTGNPTGKDSEKMYSLDGIPARFWRIQGAK
ncbi:hypothetical protein V2O64_10700 [Verrucomicrobiaceae bacterium 227]